MLRTLRRHWERLGRQDPFWAAVSWKDKSDGRWSADEFFRTGEAAVADLLERATGLGIDMPRERALDFGCGPGRLTQALVPHFGAVDGVDIARSMIANARHFNRHGDRCRYHVSRTGDLRLFDDGTFTFVCSLLVLQHMTPSIARRYIREFLRVLAPSGLLVFQVPSYDVSPSEPLASARQSASRSSLAPSACRARIRPASESLLGRAGKLVSLPVVVENTGDQAWPSLGLSNGGLRVWLGGHLASPGDEFYWRYDAARAALRADLHPGQSTTLEIGLTLPAENGDYLLELDMVQEHVCWFRQMGSATAVVRCRVEGGSARAPGGGQVPRVPRTLQVLPLAAGRPKRDSWFVRAWQRAPSIESWLRSNLTFGEAVIEMHAVSGAAIEDLVTAAGCRLVRVDRRIQADGHQDRHYWQDCHYWIVKK